ncbi:hypothetical protein PV703_33170, partial [Streptomyces sp. ME01-24h]|nr:hypothetical protein [Streptomyces sp. ME01-24h]
MTVAAVILPASHAFAQTNVNILPESADPGQPVTINADGAACLAGSASVVSSPGGLFLPSPTFALDDPTATGRTNTFTVPQGIDPGTYTIIVTCTNGTVVETDTETLRIPADGGRDSSGNEGRDSEGRDSEGRDGEGGGGDHGGGGGYGGGGYGGGHGGGHGGGYGRGHGYGGDDRCESWWGDDNGYGGG